MNPKDIFLFHLNNVLLASNACGANVFHPVLGEKIGQLSCGDVTNQISDFDPGLLETHCQASNSPFSDICFLTQTDNTLWIKVADPSGLDLDDINPDDIVIQQQGSRRSVLQIKNADRCLWLALYFAVPPPEWLSQPVNPEDQRLQLLVRLLRSASMQLTLVCDYLSLLLDPLTELCSRTVLQSKVATLSQQYSVGLVMLHCMDFQQINKKFGHDFGDRVINEIASHLKTITRENDILCRFGGALFGIAFAVNEQIDVAGLARKLQQVLQQKPFLDGAINLSFDLGAALVEFDESLESGVDRASTLINRADQALKAAQQENQPSIITWQKDDFSLYQQQFNYLGGIFTADTVTDYRNMLLLWDISSLIADKYEFKQLLQSVIQRLAQTFDFICAGLITEQEPGNPNYKFSIDTNDNAVTLTTKDRAFLTDLKEMQKLATETRRPSERHVADALVLVMPMEIESKDCFFICGHAGRFEVKHDSKVLLSGLTRQLGKALRRSTLEEELNRKLETQNEQLQNELAQLKVGLQVSSIIYQSEAMHNLMKHAKRAAMTDTTVLVTGESGTGKERLINALHQLGNRSDKPFIIVDCGSIPETLIESELFGYVKGAFTGAQHTSTGKIMDAKGGVLVLDEIGELPIQMQTKLLRFVQEKHFTPVGGNKLISVDVKIIAVTNRDLAQEVENGTFRKDLYYRLNVLTLHNPPLRDRSEDIALLSAHFLSKFAEQFKQSRKSLSDDALVRMRAYSWPGNIRELENRLMQATLLCEGPVIEWELLNIEQHPEQPGDHSLAQDTGNGDLQTPLAEPMAINPAALSANSNDNGNGKDLTPQQLNASQQPMTAQSCLHNLLAVFTQVLASASQHPQFFNAPFGSWLEDELIIKTYLATGRKMSSTASRLSISQSTARRRVDKLLLQAEQQEVVRPDQWFEIVKAVEPIAIGQVRVADCVAKIKFLALEAILATPVYSMAQAAELLGVSEPTFYKLKRELDTSGRTIIS